METWIDVGVAFNAWDVSVYGLGEDLFVDVHGYRIVSGDLEHVVA